MLRQLLKYNIIFLIFIYSCLSEKDQMIDAHFKSLSNTGVGILDKCDPDSEIYDILFSTSPYDLIQKIDYKPKSEIAKAIVHIKAENHKHAYVKDIDSLFQKLYKKGDTVLELELLKHYLHSNRKNYSSLENDLEVIGKKINSLDDLSYLDKYYRVLFLDQKAERYLTINKVLESIAIYNYILGLVENETYLKNRMVLNLSNVKIGILVNDKEYNTVHSHLDSVVSEQKFFEFEKFMNKNYADEDSIELLYKAKELAETSFEKFAVNFNLAFYYETYSPNPDSVKHYYYKTIAVYEKTPCNHYKFYPLLYFAEFLNESEEKNNILEKLETYNNCNQAIIDNIDFLKHQYIDPSTFTTDIDSMVLLVLAERKLAQKLYPGKSSLHLQDYFSKNCNILHKTLLKKESKINKDDIKKLAKTIFNTRANENDRIKNTTVRYKETANDNNVYSQIEGVLRELNDFKDVRDFNDPIYKKLYGLYEEKAQLEKQIEEKSTDQPDLDLEFFLEKSSREFTHVYNFLSYEEYSKQSEYIGYLIEKNDQELFTCSKIEIDSIGKVALQKIKNKEDASPELGKLKKLIFNDASFEEGDHLVIIPDGVIGQLPLSLIVGDDAVTISQYPNIKHWIDQKPIMLSNSDISLYSYSDMETMNNRSVKTFTDLPYGIEECNEIMDDLGLSQKALISGKKLTKQSVLSDSVGSWLHLSTHAFSNTENRLDNFITVRDQDGNGDRLYSYELMTMTEAPEVVVLSACDSGVGMHITGAGVFSISKAFLAMGTDAVIKTLWKVNDAATKEFMILFYSFLSEGFTIEQALALSQKKFTTHSTYSDPYYWAGFVVEGNGEIKLVN